MKEPSTMKPLANNLSNSTRKPLHVPKAPQIVASRIRKLIISGKLKEGDMLPPEAKLMEEFGVSRPTLREAYRILEAERLVSVARGAKGGARIHAPDPELISNYALMVLQAEGTTISEVYQARMAFEPAAVRLVIVNARKEAPKLLQEALEIERAAVNDPEQFAHAVAAFHRVLVELSGNRPLIHLWSAMHRVVEQHQVMAVSLYRRNRDDVVGDTAKGLKSQEKLIKLIEAGDPDAAEIHWRKHMQIAFKTWIPGNEDVPIAAIVED